MSDVTTIVDTYLAMWNETDPKRRAQLVERAWAGNGCYVDPMLEAEGHAAINEMVAGVQGKFPATASADSAPSTRITTSSASLGTS